MQPCQVLYEGPINVLSIYINKSVFGIFFFSQKKNIPKTDLLMYIKAHIVKIFYIIWFVRETAGKELG